MRKKNEAKVARLLELYKQTQNCHEIARLSGEPNGSVWRILKKEGCIFDRSDSASKYALDASVFDKPSPESVYWLGVLFGDGCLVTVKNKITYLSLTGHVDDIEHGQEFLNFLKSNRPIVLSKRNNSYDIRVANKELCGKLVEIGMLPRKTHTCTIPEWVPKELMSHFFRGILDSDGCVFSRTRLGYKKVQIAVSLTGNPFMMGQIATYMEIELGLKPIIRKHKKSVTISWEGAKRISKLRDWVYKDATVWLDRKKIKMYGNQ